MKDDVTPEVGEHVQSLMQQAIGIVTKCAPFLRFAKQ